MHPTTHADIANWQLVSLSAVQAILAFVSKGSECVVHCIDFTSQNEELFREITGGCVFGYREKTVQARFHFGLSKPYPAKPTWKIASGPSWISFTNGDRIELSVKDGLVSCISESLNVEPVLLSAVRQYVFEIDPPTDDNIPVPVWEKILSLNCSEIYMRMFRELSDNKNQPIPGGKLTRGVAQRIQAANQILNKAGIKFSIRSVERNSESNGTWWSTNGYKLFPKT